jgi:thiol-disulfide isomerase/thioredoxin
MLSKKDKSLLLFIAAGLIVLWVVYSLLSFIFFKATFGNSDVSKIISEEKQQWFNISKPLTKEDLKDRIILLDFWTYACVNCVQTFPEIKKLEEQFGSKLLVIGVHSGKFSNEKNSAQIRNAILKYDISHPVVNDPDFKIWQNFNVDSWPTFILLNPHGRVVETYVGENEAIKIKADVKKLISKFKYNLSREPLPIVLEKNDLIRNVLDFPTQMTYAPDFTYKSRHVPVIFIANSGQNNIVATSLSGEIILRIGSTTKSGFSDGSFDAATFKSPQGMIYDSGKLYVADTGNHALRVIDFKEGKVSTLIGSGQRGDIVDSDSEFPVTRDFSLASPSDIEFFPDKNNIAIANSGTHQILTYNLRKQTIAVLAGNGSEGLDDGKYPDNALAQTADMSVYGRKLYFIDSESSSLRVLDENKNVKTLIGKGLFDFGHVNGDKNSALMQHPLGLLVDDTGAYISDSFNHVIRKYDFATGQIRDLVGAKKAGEGLGGASSTQFNQPEGIIAILDRFYIADSNNNRIVIVGRGNLNSEILDVIPPLKLPKEGFLEYMPNLERVESISVKSDSEITIKINLKSGWKINERGPSFINLLEMTGNKEANLLSSFDWHQVKNKEMKLQKLQQGKDYILQGVIYFCEDKKNALCYVKSYEQKIIADSKEKSVEIQIKL